MKGEVTPAYSLLKPDRVATIKEWMPDLKVLFLMRDPVERAWSQAKKDFEPKMGKPLRKATFEELQSFFTLPEISARGDYVTALRNWSRFYPLEEMFLGFTEEISEAGATVLREIYGYLGVDQNPNIDWADVEQPEHTASDSTPMPPNVRSFLRDIEYARNEGLSRLISHPVPWEVIS